MNLDNNTLILCGFILPLGEVDSFAVPVFGMSQQANQIYEQVISEHGKVLAFNEIDPSFDFVRLDLGIRISTGDDACFAFYFCDEKRPIVGPRDDVAYELIDYVDRLKDKPAVHLAIAEFLGDEKERRAAQELQIRHLTMRYGQQVATGWMDSQVKLPLLRRSIAVGAFGFDENVNPADFKAIISSEDTTYLYLAERSYLAILQKGEGNLAELNARLSAFFKNNELPTTELFELRPIQVGEGLVSTKHKLEGNVGSAEFRALCDEIGTGSAAYLTSVGLHSVDMSHARSIDPNVAVQFLGLAKWIKARGGNLQLRFGPNSTKGAEASLQRILELSWPNAFHDVTGQEVSEFLDLSIDRLSASTKLVDLQKITGPLLKLFHRASKARNRIRVIQYGSNAKEKSQNLTPSEIIWGNPVALASKGEAANLFDNQISDDMGVQDSASTLSRVLLRNFISPAVRKSGARQFSFLGRLSKASKRSRRDGYYRFGCWCDGKPLFRGPSEEVHSSLALMEDAQAGPITINAVVGAQGPDHVVRVIDAVSNRKIRNLRQKVHDFLSFDSKEMTSGIQFSNLVHFFVVAMKGRVQCKSGPYTVECQWVRRSISPPIGPTIGRQDKVVLSISKSTETTAFSGSFLELNGDFDARTALIYSKSPPAPSAKGVGSLIWDIPDPYLEDDQL